MFGISFLKLSLKNRVPLVPLIFITLITSFGLLMLYSANQGLFPWAFKQIFRYVFGLGVVFFIACLDIRFWFKHAYVLYGLSLCLLVFVELLGFVGMGARRWIDLGLFQLQPSEIMKVTVIIALATYFHTLENDKLKLHHFLVPCVLIGVPLLLILRQPDLGTAIILGCAGASLLFIAGLSWRLMIPCFVGVAALCPVLWSYLKPYQKKRVLIFLNPEQDILGAGYHALQSKIAIGSGGIWGKGLKKGPQSQLNFLPEKQTDFIFTMLSEELGFVGAISLLCCYILFLVYIYRIALGANSTFLRFLVFGVASLLFFHVFINVGMVAGILPIVGVPLPLVSYGGTSLLTFMIAFGLMAAAKAQHNTRIPHHPF
jgi:rod shape determining protein RodA